MKLSDYLNSKHFLLHVIVVIVAALYVHTTVVFYSFSVVENVYIRLLTSLLFSTIISLLVLVFTIHKSTGHEWQLDVSAWLAIGTTLIFIFYMKPWNDFNTSHWHNAAIKVIAGFMIGVGEYGLPRLYMKLQKAKEHMKYISPFGEFETDDAEKMRRHLYGKIGAIKKRENNSSPIKSDGNTVLKQ